MSNKQESPEFNAQYIDQLLSGPSAGKAPAPPAEVPAPEPPKTQPTATRHPRRWILILTVALAIVLILGIFVPDLVAKLNASRWQDQTEKSYSQMVSDPLHHYKLTIQRETEDGKETRQRECWIWNRDHLYITQTDGNAPSYELVVNRNIFTKTVTPENPDVPWGPKSSVIDADTTTKTFQERNWVFSRISGTLAGPEVTYVKSGPQNIQVTFRFKWDGTLTGIKATLRSETGLYREDVYTFLETDDKEIRDTIKEAYIEAIKG